MHVRVTGTGPPMVFVHGAGGSGQNFANQFQAFRDRYRCYFIDLPGHGKSPGIPEPSIQNYAKVVSEFLESVGGPVTLVGHSMGGGVTLSVAASRRELVERVVLAGGGCRLPVGEKILVGLETDYPATLARILRHCFSKGADAELLRRAQADMENTSPEVVLGDFHACARFDMCDAVSSLDIPALIVCGSEDVMTPPHLSEQLHSLIEGSRLALIPGGSHMVMVENPSAFNALLHDLPAAPLR